MRRAAFFDLDGTLLGVNSATLWLRREWRLGRLRRRDAALAVAYLSAYRFSLIDVSHAIDKAVATLKGQSEAELKQEMSEFYATEVAPLAAPGAQKALDHHREAGDLLVLLSSAPQFFADAAAEHFELDAVLCNRYTVAEGCLTGTVHKPLCYGPGKVLHAECFANEQGVDLESSAFYTDSLSDLPMLLRVGKPVAVNPDPGLRWRAWRKGWAVEDWR